MVAKKKKSFLKTWENNPNHEYIITEEGRQQSREIAKKYVYDRNRDKYPLPFGKYKVHHINGETLNDTPENLYICTKEEHNAIHNKQKERLKKFANSSEIDYFLRSRRAKGQTSLLEIKKEYSPSYDYYSERREEIYNQKRKRRARKRGIILIIVLFFK